MVMPRLASSGIEVGDGGAVVDVAHAVRRAGVEQNALGGRRLARIDVGDDADVADVFD